MKSTVETKICELVKLGHELAKELHCAESAALVSDLASQLEVQLVRSNALAAKLSMINGLMGAAEQANKLAQEATGKLVQERDALAAENAGLKEALEYVINPDNQPEYHDQGMGCGVEDHGYQRDGYSACAYGWESAMERVYSEVIPDAIPETPATDAFLAEVRAQGVEGIYQFNTDKMGIYLDGDVCALIDHYAAQLRKGVQS
ncbi:hNH endonuclease [Citrobacter koseri]|uniref:hNH endonuclease n=1 Tax=Citrobacter koseri TaxID=545 RepID=UPI001F44BD5E|nr:hNH endonuclease [Citrobacter koseri]